MRHAQANWARATREARLSSQGHTIAHGPCRSRLALSGLATGRPYLSLLNVAEGRPLACRARPRRLLAWMRPDWQTRQGCFTHWARATQGRGLNGLAAIAELFLTSRRFATLFWSASAQRRFDLRDTVTLTNKKSLPSSKQFVKGSFVKGTRYSKMNRVLLRR